MRYVLVRCVLVLLVCLSTASALAQVVVPSLGVRSGVPEEVAERFTRLFRQELAARLDLDIDPGTLVTPGLAASLEPDFAFVIAELGGGRYGVSGVVLGSNLPNRYTVNLLVADVQTRQSSDLISQALDNTRDEADAARQAAIAVADFIRPSRSPRPGPAELFVSSDPSGADIYVNDALVGTTPQILPFRPGRYTVEVRRAGFLPQREVVMLEATQTAFLRLSLPALQGGSVQVQATPQAEVRLDGRLVGETPLTVATAAGVRELRVSRPGFRTQTLSVTVRPFRVSRVRERLEPLSDNLIYWTPPSGFEVALGSVPKPLNYALNPRLGSHTVTLRRGEREITFDIELMRRGVFELDFETRTLVPLTPFRN